MVKMLGKVKGKVLDVDWEPDQSCYEYGLKKGFTKEAYENHLEGFKFWALSNQHRAIAKKSNWYLAFKNWLRNNAEGKYNGNGNHGNRSSNETGMAEALARRNQGGLFFSDNNGKPVIDGTATEIRAIGNSELKEI